MTKTNKNTFAEYYKSDFKRHLEYLNKEYGAGIKVDDISDEYFETIFELERKIIAILLSEILRTERYYKHAIAKVIEEEFNFEGRKFTFTDFINNEDYINLFQIRYLSI